MAPPVVVCTDFDRTLFRHMSSTYLIKHNRSLDSKAALDRILDERLLNEGILRDFSVAKRKGPDTLENLADIAEWAFYDRKCIPLEAIMAIKSILMQGVSIEDIMRARMNAPEHLTPGAVEYSRRLSNSGVIHVILSYGVLPIITGAAEYLVSKGARIDAVFGREPVTAAGLVTRFKESGSKWAFAFELYGRYGLIKDKQGVFREAAVVDDSAENIERMIQHGRPVAFNPNVPDGVRFKETGVPVCRTLAEAADLVLR